MMRAFTIRQPWAWLIVGGAGKDIENRSQQWHYRGPIAIHTSKTIDLAAMDLPLVRAAFAAHVRLHGEQPLLHCGAIIGVAQYHGAHRQDDGCCRSMWAEKGPRVFHNRLSHAVPIRREIAVRGALGLWQLDPGLERLVIRQIPKIKGWA